MFKITRKNYAHRIGVAIPGSPRRVKAGTLILDAKGFVDASGLSDVVVQL